MDSHASFTARIKQLNYKNKKKRKQKQQQITTSVLYSGKQSNIEQLKRYKAMRTRGLYAAGSTSSTQGSLPNSADVDELLWPTGCIQLALHLA
jgi:hypothetical protein